MEEEEDTKKSQKKNLIQKFLQYFKPNTKYHFKTNLALVYNAYSTVRS